MNTEKLFRHPEIFVLPERGAFTPLECLQEWIETIEHAFTRYTEMASDPNRIAEIGPSAAHLFSESENDLAKLLAHLESEDDFAEAQKLNSLRDDLREYDVFPALADEVNASRESIRTSLRMQVASARELIAHAGPPPLTPERQAIARKAWDTTDAMIQHISAIPALDPATMDCLTELRTLVDTIRGLFP